MKKAMRIFFQQFVAQWESIGEGAPKAPWEPDADSFIWVGAPDEDEMVRWLPIEKDAIHDLAEIASDLPELHSSIAEYFNSWWFCTLEGYYDGYFLMLDPVIPGIEFDSFLSNTRGYMSAHQGELNYVPIGMENEGLMVVVDNTDGRVFLEDYEISSFDLLAGSLEELVESLKY